MVGSPRVAVLSRRLVENKVWQASQYEFEDVVQAVADVHLVAPRPRPGSAAARLVHRSTNRARAVLGSSPRDRLDIPGEAVDADLFFAVFSTPYEIGALPHMREQLARSSVKVAYIVELYAPGILGTARRYLEQLRGFDHIFVFSRAVLPELQALTGVPCSFLATGVDALRFAPPVPPPLRSIDVVSYGRRHGGVHAALRGAMTGGSLHYQFDTSRMPFEVTDHVDHRVHLAATLRRSRYAVVHKINDEPNRVARTGGEETLTNRYFEATAAGAVVLGSSPDAADFAECFPWRDAVVPVQPDGSDVLEVIAELDADPARASATRQAGVTAALEHHDWAYRWQQVLAAVGVAQSPRLTARLQLLADRAEQYRAVGGGLLPPAGATPGSRFGDHAPLTREGSVTLAV